MKELSDEILLSFLEGTLAESERQEVLDRLESDPELARAVRSAARGLEMVRLPGGAAPGTLPTRVDPVPAGRGSRARRISPWWAVAAAAATLLVSVPATLQFRRQPSAEAVSVVVGQPVSPDPSFVLVLLGRWPDAADLPQGETGRRAAEYWAWASSLADEGLLVAAGDLRWEPGERLRPGGVQVAVDPSIVDNGDYIVGMFTIRANGYDEALALARDCPHLRYGGSVAVRRVAGGFVTVPGMGDSAD